MYFHELVFKNKGWGPEQKRIVSCVISIMRSDRCDQARYCSFFFQELVRAMDRIGFRRSDLSFDVDEPNARLLSKDPSTLAPTLEKIQSHKQPIVIFGEDTPLSQHSLLEFADRLLKDHDIKEVLVVAFDPSTSDLNITIRAKDKRDVNFQLTAKTNTLKEVA